MMDKGKSISVRDQVVVHSASLWHRSAATAIWLPTNLASKISGECFKQVAAILDVIKHGKLSAANLLYVMLDISLQKWQHQQIRCGRALMMTCRGGYGAPDKEPKGRVPGRPRGGAPLGCTAKMDCTRGLFLAAFSSLSLRLAAFDVVASHLTLRATSRAVFLGRTAAALRYLSKGVCLDTGYLSSVASKATCSSAVQSVE